jgi:hypothetical protein
MVHFRGRLNEKWYLLFPFGIFCVIWCILLSFGMLYQEKYCNPDCQNVFDALNCARFEFREAGLPDGSISIPKSHFG